MNNFAQIAYKGANLSVDVETPVAPGIPTGGQLYLNSGDFVPYFKFNALPDGEADSYQTEAWKSSAPATKLTEESDAGTITIEGGIKNVYRTYPISGTALGTISPGTTINARARAILNGLAGDWTQTYSVIYQY